MNFRKKSVWLLSSIVSLQLSGTAVQAQQAQAPKVARVDKSLEEIVVTARKREESIQDIPVSVTPFTADSLERRGFTGLDDIAAATPGFTYEGFITGGNHGNAVIRGLAQQFTTSRIQNVSFFIDGVYLQRQSMLNLGMIDMERVEVIKGPQNALFGRNAFAGAVNYITAKPKA
ncbi:TonB-dependent receptor plug domain-containing protein, partial [Litorivivens sp.]